MANVDIDMNITSNTSTATVTTQVLTDFPFDDTNIDRDEWVIKQGQYNNKKWGMLVKKTPIKFEGLDAYKPNITFYSYREDGTKSIGEYSGYVNNFYVYPIVDAAYIRNNNTTLALFEDYYTAFTQIAELLDEGMPISDVLGGDAQLGWSHSNDTTKIYYDADLSLSGLTLPTNEELNINTETLKMFKRENFLSFHDNRVPASLRDYTKYSIEFNGRANDSMPSRDSYTYPFLIDHWTSSIKLTAYTKINIGNAYSGESCVPYPFDKLAFFKKQTAGYKKFTCNYILVSGVNQVETP